MNNLWMMDINGLDSFKQGETEYETNPEWQLIETSGMVNSVKPPPISHHTSTVYGDKMFLFGGSSKNAENLNLYSLDLIKYQWQIIKAKPSGGKEDNLPTTRDEHSCLVYQDSMIVFGGFAFGERTNSIFKYSFKQNSWEKIPHKGSNAPCPRAGHSAVIRLDGQGDHMVIFGGKDDENQKLSDTWKFNMTSCEWSKIEVPGEEPLPRSGHASQIYNDFMIIYGGIYEVTKELNDMHVFDLKNERWLCLF
jgi:N-acetylneuraminic acid mutarotase